MASIIERGSQAFLQQANRNNWQRYLASLGRSDSQKRLSSLPAQRRNHWDVCILTASDQNQAHMVRQQLDMRRDAGLLPIGVNFYVVADPDGQRIGSGGATLRIFNGLFGGNRRALHSLISDNVDGLSTVNADEQRILIIHSGGDSRRLPHCSATGKLFARIPRVLPDGRASTIFDEFLINLSGVVGGLPSGLLLVSGDVLLVFDHLQLSFQRQGVTGVCVAANAEMGTRHGVYVSSSGHRDVDTFLHKPSMNTLTQWQAVDGNGKVQIDTGLVWFDTSTARRFAQLTENPHVADLCGLEGFQTGKSQLTPLNLYGDLLLPMAVRTQFTDYLNDSSDGPATPALQAARHIIWNQVRGAQFTVERLRPAVFVHFGTSEEYWQMLAADRQLADICDWSPQASSWLDHPAEVPRDAYVLVNAAVETPAYSSKTGTSAVSPAQPDSSAQQLLHPPVLVADSHLGAGLTWLGRCVVAGVRTREPIALHGEYVLHQLPVDDGYVTRLFGLLDDPKQPWDDPAASYLNRNWRTWLEEFDEPPEVLWPDLPRAEWTLWTARLFPISLDRLGSLQMTLPLQNPTQVVPEWKRRWKASNRLSLAESFVRANGQELLSDLTGLEDFVAAKQFYAAVQSEQPAAQTASWLGSAGSGIALRRGKHVEAWVSDADPELQMRGWKALAVATANSRFEDRAFDVLAQQIENDVIRRHRQLGRELAPLAGARLGTHVRVEVAARIDFGGGWTDTPPYSIERGGTVLNAAILLHGRYPIVTEAVKIPERRLVLESRDIDDTLIPELAGDVLAYRNPADPFALLKAALVMKGVVPADCRPDMPISALLGQGHGLHLTTQTRIPRGSGLGTSSIMAGAVLATLDDLYGTQSSQDELFDQVLCLEQMLTTGGGWQDQVGGLVGGVKLVTTEPGLPQQIRLASLELSANTTAALRERLVLVYTGQQRLAKNLLRSVMGRWMARDPEMVWILEEIGRLALAMRDALQADDLDAFGRLLGEHWQLNKRMDPGCTNPFIDDLFDFISPYVCGGKLAGAGGGGFAFVITRNRDAAAALQSALVDHYADTPIATWPVQIAEAGMSHFSLSH